MPARRLRSADTPVIPGSSDDDPSSPPHRQTRSRARQAQQAEPEVPPAASRPASSKHQSARAFASLFPQPPSKPEKAPAQPGIRKRPADTSTQTRNSPSPLPPSPPRASAAAQQVSSATASRPRQSVLSQLLSAAPSQSTTRSQGVLGGVSSTATSQIKRRGPASGPGSRALYGSAPEACRALEEAVEEEEEGVEEEEEGRGGRRGAQQASTLSAPPRKLLGKSSRPAEYPPDFQNQTWSSAQTQRLEAAAQAGPSSSQAAAAPKLEVNARKVGQVRDWILGAAARPSPAALVLSGPPGCGKTTLVRVLAKHLDLELLEWTGDGESRGWGGGEGRGWGGRTPFDGGSYAAAPPSALQSLEAFLARSRLSGLGLTKSMGSPCASQPRARARPKLLLLDDLPLPHSVEAVQRLALLLNRAVRAARSPIILTVTQSTAGNGRPNGARQNGGGTSNGDGSSSLLPVLSSSAAFSTAPSGLLKEVENALVLAGAAFVALNAPTQAACVRALARAASEERAAASAERLEEVAAAAGGDLANALATLQLLSSGEPRGERAAEGKSGMRKRRGRGSEADKEKALGKAATQTSLSYGKDGSLTLFHALGKVLYGKRGVAQEKDAEGSGELAPGRKLFKSTEVVPFENPFDASSRAAPCAGEDPEQSPSGVEAGGFEQSGLRICPAEGRRDTDAWLAAGDDESLDFFAPSDDPLAARQSRAPLSFDPEEVVRQCALEPASILAFLQENVLEFVSATATDDLAEVASQLSEAEHLASLALRPQHRQDYSGDAEETGVPSQAASSAAVRGLCWALAHSAPHRWLPLRAPSLFVAARGREANARGLAWARGRGAVARGGGGMDAGRAAAAEIVPVLRSFASLRGDSADMVRWTREAADALPRSWARLWQGALYHAALGTEGALAAEREEEQGAENEGDAIEEA